MTQTIFIVSKIRILVIVIYLAFGAWDLVLIQHFLTQVYVCLFVSTIP